MADYTSNTDQHIALASSIIATYVDGIMFILATVGNTMNIIIFSCLKPYRSLPTSAFLATASFAGQVYVTFALGFSSLSRIIGYNISATNSAICKAFFYLQPLGIQISLTCLCLSSIDRYLMTTRSARLRDLITLRRARFIIWICIVAWSCIEIPNALYTLNIPSYELCSPTVDYILTSSVFDLVFAVFVPIIILSVFGLLTCKNLGRTRLTAINAQVTKMILLDVVVVALSNIPLGSFYIYIETKSTKVTTTPIEDLFLVLTQLISSTQSAGSFYFYLIISSAFRSNTKSLFCFWKPRPMNRIAQSTLVPSALPNVVA